MMDGTHRLARRSITQGALPGNGCTQVVFIDPSVRDHHALLGGLDTGAAGYVLDPARDGVQQIAEALADRTGLSAVSVIAHGMAGSVRLGSTCLDDAGLPRHAAGLRAIGRAIAPAGRFQMFACEAGKGPGGHAFVQALSRAAGTAVAASSRALGGAEGGDEWSLDVHSAPGVAAPGLPIAAEVLSSYEHALSGAGAPPSGFPLDVNDFSTSGSSFVQNGDAAISGTALQLTPDANGKAGTAVYDQSFSSNLGLSVQFTYDSSGGSGADGISFFLLNGDTVTSASNVTSGGYGGGLGYSDNGQAGITGGYLGVGFDTFGNYAQTDHGQSSSGLNGSTANYIGVRGQGSGTTGYNWITGAPYTPGIDGTRTVQVNVTKIDATHEQLQVYMEPSGSNTFTKVIDTTVNQTLPSSFYFGFAASTGGSDDLHQIDNVSVKLPVNLTFGTATVQDQTTGQTNPATLNPGDQFSYTYTLTSSGPNDDGQITVNDALPANIQGASWTVTDNAGTHTGTGSAIGVNLLNGASATITVSGTVDPNATSGNADHAITVSPGAAYSLANPNEAAPVTLNIGSGGSSVSLVGANQGSATPDTAPITPFSGAQIVDTYTEPGTGAAPVDAMTVQVDSNAGALSAAGATYNAATGVLTASGTAAQLQAALQSVTFTPAAHSAAPGSTSPVALDVTVTDPDNSSGGTSASATQMATVTVTAAHDTPTITGAASAQSVNDDATGTPFSGLAVTDPDMTGASVTVTIADGSANGSFTAAASAGWSESAAANGDLVYTLTLGAQQDIGAAVQSAVRSLVFQPSPLTSERGGSATVGFTVAVADSATPSLSASDSNTSVVVRDVTPPAAPTGLALAPASDSGAKGDDITNVIRPTITGTAEPGSTVTLDDGTTQLGTAAVAADGTWSFTTGALADGTHNLAAVATDAAGNVSTPSQALPLRIDTTVPAVTAALLHDTGASATDGITSDDTVTGSGDPGGTVSVSEGTTTLGTATADSAGHWTFAPTGLADGAHTLVASETDAAGNTGMAQVSLTLETAAPVVTAALLDDTGASATDGITSDDTVTGTAEAGGMVMVSEGGTALGTATADSAGHWTFAPIGLADGAHALVASETDAAGNAASAQVSLTLETAVPVVTAALLDDTGASATDGITSDPALTGTGEAGATITLSKGGRSLGTAAVDGTGHWTLMPTGLVDGAQAVTVSDTDAAGNVGTAQVSFTLDTTSPAAPTGLALAPASDSGAMGDDITNVIRPTITGTAEPGSIVTLDDGITQLGTAAVAADGTWSFTTGALADGLHHLTTTATDGAGNRSATPSALGLTIDTSVPSVTAAAEDNPADPVTDAKLLAGSGDPNATIAISEGTTAVGTAQVGADGHWVFDPSSLTPGAHTLTASETNAAGNIGTAPAVALTVPDPRFDLTNLTASSSGAFLGNDYTGPVSYLQAEYSYTGSGNVVLGARVANVFLRSGSGEDALAAKAGSNVLDGGAGSNWLVGASGADGGNDTFFVDGRGGQDTWDTLLNFHRGDMLTLWGYSAASGSLSWSDDKGAAGYHGATLQASFGGGSGTSALVTFGGLSTGGTHFITGTGTSGGIPFLMVTRTS